MSQHENYGVKGHGRNSNNIYNARAQRNVGKNVVYRNNKRISNSINYLNHKSGWVRLQNTKCDSNQKQNLKNTNNIIRKVI